MHFFELRNFQDFMLYLFPALVFVFIFGIGLAFTHIKRTDSEERKAKVIEVFVSNIRERNAPFPLILYLIIYGTVVWSVLYIVLTGVLGIKI